MMPKASNANGMCPNHPERIGTISPSSKGDGPWYCTECGRNEAESAHSVGVTSSGLEALTQIRHRLRMPVQTREPGEDG